MNDNDEDLLPPNYIRGFLAGLSVGIGLATFIIWLALIAATS